MTDPTLVDAEDTLMRYQRGLREGILYGVNDVRVLTEVLEFVLDKYAELSVAFEPEDFEEEDVFLDPDFDDDEPYNHPDEIIEDEFPYVGDGDHSESRGNG